MVLGCGGTIINIEEGERVAEMAWNEFNGGEATGGGYSNYYGTPQYQAQAISKYPYLKEGGRGVPDVAALSSTIDGFQVIQDKQKVVVGGTSTATPMWAALIALMNEKLGYNLGFCNHLLYELAGTKSFNQIVNGNNLLYKAAPYWNPCTGLGSPSGDDLIENIQKNEPNSDLETDKN